MQITIDQTEIEEAIRAYVSGRVTIRDDQEVDIDLRAGRGEHGFTATLDIRTRLGQTNKPKPAFAGIRTPVQIRETQPAHDAEPEEGPKQEEVPKAKAPHKPAAPGIQKKGIFATVPKTAPETTEEVNEAEPGVPDQEMPAEEQARQAAQSAAEKGDQEGAQDAVQDAAQNGSEAPAGQPESKKSIFTFAPKKSAG